MRIKVPWEFSPAGPTGKCFIWVNDVNLSCDCLEDNKIPMGFYSLNKNRIKIPQEIFPVGETKYAVLDSNVIISCSVDKEVGIYIQKKY